MQVLKPKGRGAGLMVSDFIEERDGHAENRLFMQDLQPPPFWRDSPYFKQLTSGT